VFYLDPEQIYRVTELDALPWLAHGFGTRSSDIPGRFAQLTTVKQIHSSTCIAGEGRSGILGEGDALIENTPGSVVAVKTADCVPILLADERLQAVAAIHAGWRGTAARIAERAIAMMTERFGTRPADLHAAIGPGIGECCYEVGAEVREQFGAEGSGQLDLSMENVRQLEQSGVTRQRIYTSNLCTRCRTGEFHSFRRDRDAAGRMYSFAGVL
jgi:YfiH family protein